MEEEGVVMMSFLWLGVLVDVKGILDVIFVLFLDVESVESVECVCEYLL